MNLGKYEIQHNNPNTNKVQYNSYHKCMNVSEAVLKHITKGYLVKNIQNITFHRKYKFKKDELDVILNTFSGGQ